MASLLKNGTFDDSYSKTYANWNGWYYAAGQAVCVCQKKVANAKTGFYQDIPANRFKSNGKYRFQMRLLSTTANAWVAPTVWVFKKGKNAVPTQKKFKLKKGQWQIIEVEVNLNRTNLKKVRAELYFGPNSAEVIIQRAYFGK